MEGAVVLFVDTSQDFAAGHVPGSRWIARGWLELRIGDHGIERDAPIGVTCLDGRASALAGVTLYGLGYSNVSFLDGGMAAWRDAGLPVERGLTGVMAMPGDIPNRRRAGGPRSAAVCGRRALPPMGDRPRRQIPRIGGHAWPFVLSL